MTIALGLNFNGGIVIAADTLETHYSMKVSTAKVKLSARSDFGAIVISGAGTAGYIDSISQEFQRMFMASDSSESLDGLEAKFKILLEEFYAKHVLLPFEREKRHFSLIIGVTKGSDCKLWTSEEDTLKSSQGFAAVGVGAEFALTVLSHYYRYSLPREQGELLASYVTYLAKETIDSCGKYTDVVSVYGPMFNLIPRLTTQFMENQFAQFSLFETAAVQYMLGRPVKDKAGSRKSLISFLDGIRSEIQGEHKSNIVEHPVIDWGDDRFHGK